MGVSKLAESKVDLRLQRRRHFATILAGHNDVVSDLIIETRVVLFDHPFIHFSKLFGFLVISMDQNYLTSRKKYP